LSAATERSRIIQAGDHTYLQVGLQGMKGEAPRRPPLNVVLVLDRTGSMASEQKLEFARAAAAALVDRLTPDDVFSLVVFDSAARVAVPAGRVRDKGRIKKEIAALTPGGGTNLYDGLQLGYREAGKNAAREGVNL